MSVRDFVLKDGNQLRFVTDMIDVSSSMPVPDPEWRDKDIAGHEHYAELTPEGITTYPTLESVLVDRYFCEDCGSEHQTHAWRCRVCQQIILPGTTWPDSTSVPGLTTAYLNGRQILMNEAKALLEREGEHL